MQVIISIIAMLSAISFLFIMLFIVRMLIGAYLCIMVIRMIVDWLMVLVPRMRLQGIFAVLMNIIYSITEPPLRWLRRFVPPVRCGNISIDVSYMLLYVVLYALQIIL
ncbi:YggT family protein [Gardnerella vaginalis]|uniref:YggT family protein n=1 Tax=Gardnerella TaxID=2701 RepID=UPI0004080135|nr:YggT family protein [Gardnerella vaginalis]